MKKKMHACTVRRTRKYFCVCILQNFGALTLLDHVNYHLFSQKKGTFTPSSDRIQFFTRCIAVRGLWPQKDNELFIR